MKFNLKKYIKKILVIIAFIVLICIFAYIIVEKLKIDWIVYILKKGDYISGLGSILGGIIGGLFAINVLKKSNEFEKKQAKEDQRLSVYPFLEYKIIECNVEKDSKEKVEDIFGTYFRNKECLKFTMSIDNLGNGNALFVIFDDWKWKDKSEKVILDLMQDYDVGSIAKEKSRNITMAISTPSYERFKEEVGQKEILYREVIYKDILENEYKDGLTFEYYRYQEDTGVKKIIHDEIKLVKVERNIKRKKEVDDKHNCMNEKELLKLYSKVGKKEGAYIKFRKSLDDMLKGKNKEEILELKKICEKRISQLKRKNIIVDVTSLTAMISAVLPIMTAVMDVYKKITDALIWLLKKNLVDEKTGKVLVQNFFSGIDQISTSAVKGIANLIIPFWLAVVVAIIVWLILCIKYTEWISEKREFYEEVKSVLDNI